MGKFALLVGINYHKNPEAALKGCVNDTKFIRKILLEKGFASKNIKMINDEDRDVPDPTGAEVKRGLHWLCSNRKKNDVVVFHYSGHGTQVPSDGDDHEADNKDEAIVLENMFLLVDDDIKQFFSMLPVGCQATMIGDCCHSGGMLDGESVAIGGDKGNDGQGFSRDVQGESADRALVPRSLPVNLIAQIMGKLLGKSVSPTGNGLAGGMAGLHGGDAGKLALMFVASQLAGGKNKGLGQLLSMAAGAGSSAFAPSPPPRPQGAAGLLSSFMGGSSSQSPFGNSSQSAPTPSASPFGGLLGDLGLTGTMPATSAGAPAYKPTEQKIKMDPRVGILITGCQSNQTSADVRPRNGEPHGALTYAIMQAYSKNKRCSNSDLVYEVRSQLQKKRMSQNPQLECTDSNAKMPFICGPRKMNGRRRR